jgi:hypothetical protein
MRLHYTLEVANLGQLAGVLALIREVRGVTRAARRGQAPAGKGTSG